MTEIPPSRDDAMLMSDEDFEALEEVLVSEVVPEDCMDLEMLDGFLAAVLTAPQPVPLERWLPAVWSAHGEEASFGSGRGVQRAIGLVKAYYNEMIGTLGRDDDDEHCWEPFCFAVAEGDALRIGEEWIDGFAQGLDLWARDWDEDFDAEAVAAVRDTLDEVLAPWGDEEAGNADAETRLQWLAAVGEAVNDIYAHWRDQGIPYPALLDLSAPAAPGPVTPGRNEACPCGSGKKYKRCCGANGGEGGDNEDAAAGADSGGDGGD